MYWNYEDNKYPIESKWLVYLHLVAFCGINVGNMLYIHTLIIWVRNLEPLMGIDHKKATQFYETNGDRGFFQSKGLTFEDHFSCWLLGSQFIMGLLKANNSQFKELIIYLLLINFMVFLQPLLGSNSTQLPLAWNMLKKCKWPSSIQSMGILQSGPITPFIAVK